MRKKIVLKYLITGLLIILVIIFVIINNISQYRLGKFVEIGQLKYIHGPADAFAISDGRIIILGNDLRGIPTEIYDPITQKVDVFNFPHNLKIIEQGLPLDNNKILLLRACDTKFSNCNNYDNFAKNIVVYNINTQQFKIFPQFKDSGYLSIYDYFMLENGSVVIIIKDFKRGNGFFLVVYNPQKDTLEFSNVYPQKLSPMIKGIPINNNEILLFENGHSIKKYNILKKSLEDLNVKPNNPKGASYTKFNNKVLIINKEFGNNLYNELYDIENNSILKLPRMCNERTRYFLHNVSGNKTLYNTINIDNKYILITGGQHRHLKKIISSAEVYDIKKSKFKKITNMKYPHASHDVIKTKQGLVIIGGYMRNIELFK